MSLNQGYQSLLFPQNAWLDAVDVNLKWSVSGFLGILWLCQQALEAFIVKLSQCLNAWTLHATWLTCLYLVRIMISVEAPVFVGQACCMRTVGGMMVFISPNSPFSQDSCTLSVMLFIIMKWLSCFTSWFLSLWLLCLWGISGEWERVQQWQMVPSNEFYFAWHGSLHLSWNCTRDRWNVVQVSHKNNECKQITCNTLRQTESPPGEKCRHWYYLSKWETTKTTSL